MPELSLLTPQTAAEARMEPLSKPNRRAALLGAAVLTGLAAILFLPPAERGMVGMDVVEEIEENPHVHGLSLENVKYILTSRCLRSYYPIRSLSFALDYQLWGLDARGFRLTNCAIHLANVLLVFWLTMRLFRRWGLAKAGPASIWDACSAGLAALLFAVHPVVVEPVAWVCGREELLMTLGALGTIHFHITARQLEDRGRRGPMLACHAGAILCCLGACLSNVVGAVVPALVVALDILMPRKLGWRRIGLGTAGLWLAAGAAILLKKLTPGIDVQVEAEPGVFSYARLLLALNVYGHNSSAIVWPTALAPFYGHLSPRSFLDPEVILGTLAAAVSGGIFARAVVGARRSSPGWSAAAFGLAWFPLALAPAAQIVPHHIHLADRFLYLPLVGVALAAAVGVRGMERHAHRLAVLVGLAAVVLIVCGSLARLTAGQVEVWKSNVALWQHAVRAVPDSSSSHGMLADSLAAAGRHEEAIAEFKKALELSRANLDAMEHYGLLLATCPRQELRDYPMALWLARQSCHLSNGEEPQRLRSLAKVYASYALDLYFHQQPALSVQYLRKAVKLSPQDEVILLRLASILLDCPDPSLRNPEEAVRLAEQACGRFKEPNPAALTFLALAYGKTGRFAQAIAVNQKAIEAAEAAGNASLVSELRRQKAGLYQGRYSPVAPL